MSIRPASAKSAYTGKDGASGPPGPPGPPGAAQWVVVSFTHLNFQAAALQKNINLYPLLGKYALHASVIDHTIAFAGTGITGYTLSLGLIGDLAHIAPPFDVTTTPADDNFQIAGITDLYNMSATTLMRINAVSTGANLDQSTAGAVDVYLLISSLP